MMSGTSVGLDIGTFSSCVAFVCSPQIDVIESDFGKQTIPTYVAFHERQRAFGPIAESQFEMYFENTVFNFKPLIGRKFNKNEVAEIASQLPFRVQLSDRRLLISIVTDTVNKSFYPEQILAMYLIYIKSMIIKRASSELIMPVIGVPHCFTKEQRDALLSACQLAGLNKAELLDETQAIVTFYGLYGPPLPSHNETSRHVVFVSVGHMHTQACVCALKRGQFRFLSTASQADLGGYCFDRVLCDLVRDQFMHQHGIRIDPHSFEFARLISECISMKKQLNSNGSRISVRINEIGPPIELARFEFQKAIEPILIRLRETLEQCLRESDLQKEQIAKVELIGLTCRIVEVKQLISSVFGMEGSWSLNSNEVVARGCAIHAAIRNKCLSVENFDLIGSFGMLPKEKLIEFMNVENELSYQDQHERELQTKANEVENSIYKILNELKAKPLAFLCSNEAETFYTFAQKMIEQLRSPRQDRSTEMFNGILSKVVQEKIRLQSLDSNRQIFVRSLNEILTSLQFTASKITDALPQYGKFMNKIKSAETDSKIYIRELLNFINATPGIAAQLATLKSEGAKLNGVRPFEETKINVPGNGQSVPSFPSFYKLKDRLNASLGLAEQACGALPAELDCFKEGALMILRDYHGQTKINRTAIESSKTAKSAFDELMECKSQIIGCMDDKVKVSNSKHAVFGTGAESQWVKEHGTLQTNLTNLCNSLQSSQSHHHSTDVTNTTQIIGERLALVISAGQDSLAKLDADSQSQQQGSMEQWNNLKNELKRTLDQIASSWEQHMNTQGSNSKQTSQVINLTGSPYGCNQTQNEGFHSMSQNHHHLNEVIDHLRESCKNLKDVLNKLKAIYLPTIKDEKAQDSRELPNAFDEFEQSWKKYKDLFPKSFSLTSVFNASFTVVEFCEARQSINSSMKLLLSAVEQWARTTQTNVNQNANTARRLEQRTRNTLNSIQNTLERNVPCVLECAVNEIQSHVRVKKVDEHHKILKTWEQLNNSFKEYHSVLKELEDGLETYKRAFPFYTVELLHTWNPSISSTTV